MYGVGRAGRLGVAEGTLVKVGCLATTPEALDKKIAAPVPAPLYKPKIYTMGPDSATAKPEPTSPPVIKPEPTDTSVVKPEPASVKAEPSSASPPVVKPDPDVAPAGAGGPSQVGHEPATSASSTIKPDPDAAQPEGLGPSTAGTGGDAGSVAGADVAAENAGPDSVPQGDWAGDRERTEADGGPGPMGEVGSGEEAVAEPPGFEELMVEASLHKRPASRDPRWQMMSKRIKLEQQ